jgi:SNF2 family N-terminal domain.
MNKLHFCVWNKKKTQVILAAILFQKSRPKDYRLLPQIPVMLISYEMFVRYYDDISQMHFDLLICDEGHRLKNTTIKTYAVSTKDINSISVGQLSNIKSVSFFCLIIVIYLDSCSISWTANEESF